MALPSRKCSGMTGLRPPMCFSLTANTKWPDVARKTPENNTRMEDSNQPDVLHTNLVTFISSFYIMDQNYCPFWAPFSITSLSSLSDPLPTDHIHHPIHVQTFSQLSNLSVPHLPCLLNAPSSLQFSALLPVLGALFLGWFLVYSFIGLLPVCLIPSSVPSYFTILLPD